MVRPSKWQLYGILTVSTALLAFFLISSLLDSQASSNLNSVEVTTMLRTQLPPEQGAPVCLTASVVPIGSVRSVRLSPDGAKYHDGWDVVIEITTPEKSGITTDSVVDARLPNRDVSQNCGGSRDVFLDINVPGGGPLIGNRSILKGEVTYFAEVPYMVPPRPWWEKIFVWVVCLIVICAAITLIILMRRISLRPGRQR